MESNQLPHAWGRPAIMAVVRGTPEDFQVDEELGFPPDGQGQHVLLRIRKRNTNTQWLARQLARFAGIPLRDVGFAGLKDRCAVTTQWFSLDLAGKEEPDWCSLDLEDIQIIDVARHGRKLRRGALRGNRFILQLHRIEGDTGELERRLHLVRQQGVPNYFGEQRFGRGGSNLVQAEAMFSGEIRVKDRHRRGLYLSAARSLLFNRILAERVKTASWRNVLPGEVVMLSGSRSFFTVEVLSAEIEQRLASGDILPTAPLWGRGLSTAQAAALALETEVLSAFRSWCDGLESAGLKQERRPLLLQPADLVWEWTGEETLRMSFFLSAGSYATSVLRELVVPLPGGEES